MPRGHTFDLDGQRFGRLTVVGRAERPDTKSGAYVYWMAECDCGGKAVVRSSRLVSGETQSCGCLRVERIKAANTSHGMTNTKTWKVWSSMWERCTNEASPHFKGYGARGISVCERWKEFPNFLEDMGVKPAGKSLDRINNNGNYEPSNCRWADCKTQSRNRRSSVVVNLNGRAVLSAEIADALGVDPSVISRRLRAGWSAERAATQPVRSRRAA